MLEHPKPSAVILGKKRHRVKSVFVRIRCVMKSHIDGSLQPELCIYKLVDLAPSVCLKLNNLMSVPVHVGIIVSYCP